MAQLEQNEAKALLTKRLKLKDMIKEVEDELRVMGIDFSQMRKKNGVRKEKVMTPNQYNVWKFMVEYQEKNGEPPLYLEVQCKFNYKNSNSVSNILKGLENKGWAKKDTSRTSRKWVALKKQWS